MSRLLASVTYPRCPACDAVAYPAWATEHRPGCPYTHTDPDAWLTTDKGTS
jgi:hypothetical protein